MAHRKTTRPSLSARPKNPQLPISRHSAEGLQPGPQDDAIWQSLLGISQDAIIATDPVGLIRRWSPGAVTLYGYSEAEILGRPFSNLATTARRHVTQEVIRRACQGERFHTLEGCHERKDGSALDVQLAINAIRSDDGEVRGILVVSRDASHRNLMLANASEMQIVIDSLAGVVCYVDIEQRVRFMNRRPKSFLGVAPLNETGRPIRDVVGESFYENIRVELVRALNGERADFDVQRQVPGSQPQFFRVTTQPDFDAFGKVRGAVMLVTDTSNDRMNAIRLVGSEHRIRVIGEGSPFGIIKLNAEGHIEYANTRWRKIMGLSLARSMTEDWLHHVAELEQEEVRTAWYRCLADHADFLHEFRIRAPGVERWVQLNIKSLYDDEGHSFVGIAQDTTQRKQAELHMAEHAEALKKANESLEAQQRELQNINEALSNAKSDAEAATRAKSEFLANMSHEIRTPMTAILGFTDILLDPSNSPSVAHEAAQTIRRNGAHLLQIIKDILDVSKIEAGRMGVERVACSPVEIVADVAETLRARANVKGLTLTTVFQTPMPRTILTDPTRLRQILLNLVGNAIKFTDSGYVRVDVRLNPARAHAADLILDVVDSGMGMTESQMDRLFQPFSQADMSTTRRFGGTGLGLSISQRLAQMLGGEITIQSRLGGGSVFRVRIDAGPADGEQRIPEVPNPTKDASGAETSEIPSPNVIAGFHVLYAEDGPDNQRLISLILQKAGVHVEIVENGRRAVDEALRAWQADQPFDVILMDMQMPELDGFEATRLLRNEGYTGPIIALTAHAMSTDRDKCINSGCDFFLSKPISRNNLISTIASFRSTASSRVHRDNTHPSKS